MQPVFKTLPAHRYAMRPLYYLTAIGALLGAVYWITCYRLAPAAFRASPRK